MSDNPESPENENADPGEIIRPAEQVVIVSPDRLAVGLVFQDQNGKRLTILLPLLAAAHLRHRLGEILDTLGAAADGMRHTTGKLN